MHEGQEQESPAQGQPAQGPGGESASPRQAQPVVEPWTGFTRGGGPQQRPPQPPGYGGMGGPPPSWPTAPAPRRRRWPIVLLAMLLVGSAIANVILLGALGVVSELGMGAQGGFRKTVLEEGAGNQVVAVVPVYDMIDENMADWVKHALDELAADPAVQIVVLHVDSLGGTVPASDQINHALQQFKDSGKKVVISQGGYATSGGYYVSAAGDYIFAEPTTWTGNIGVIMTSFVARGGLEEKLGIQPVVITSSKTPFKDVPSLFRDMQPEERAYVQGLVDAAYDRFVDVVNDGRPDLDRDEVVALANGKVYTADQAKAAKLIDEVGYLQDATDKAAELAGLTNAKVVLYAPRVAGLAEVLFGESSTPALEKLAGRSGPALEGLTAPRLMYMYPGQWPAGGGQRLTYPARGQ